LVDPVRSVDARVGVKREGLEVVRPRIEPKPVKGSTGVR